MKHPNPIRHILLLSFLLVIPLLTHAQQTIAEWNFPNSPDDATVDIAIPINATATISSQGGTGVMAFSNAGATTRSAHTDNWVNGNGLKWWEITLNTTGYINLDVSSKQRSSNTGPRDFKIQYRIGAGAWADLVGATTIITSTTWASGVVNSIPLPAICYNQPAISLRWIMTSNTAVGGAAVALGGVSNIDDIRISWNSDDYYQSVMNGNWNNIATWESSPDNITWNPAIMAPSNFARTITIRNPHIVTINTNVNLDETIVQNGATLNWASSGLTIWNGPGIDLQVNGTFNDVSPTNVLFNASATWTLGVAATYIKSSAFSAVNWTNNYNGGIATIPATANWIIRKIGAPNPSVVSVNVFYPNLIIENNTAGIWVASGSSGFQGAVGNAVIKGYMDIGGSGSSTVEFENINTNAAATVVTGNLTIRAGSILRNYGTGFELFSNLNCDGNLIYDANGSRRIIFSGNSAQVILGGGNLNIFNMVMNKSGNDLTLLRTVKIDNNITFNNPGGRIFSSSVNLLIIESLATSTTPNNTSFVHGPVQKLGSPLFIFPVGKNNDFQAIELGVGSGGGGGVFWTENFSTGCNTGQLASSYSGINGAWTITNTGTNDPGANTWYVSATENGQGAGVCGAGCGTNATLHLGSTFLALDPGAAYYESTPGFCPGFFPCSYTDRRADSPVINCTGQTGITLSLNYLEFGEGANDNATLWYFDGATWNLLVDLPKTLCCGGVACDGFSQALWTSFSIGLPGSANNNPNVRLGFRWVNNADGLATDPSFAVDDIRLSTAVSAAAYTAEYFRGNPQVIFNNTVNPNINHISQCEYWTLTQDAGTSARTVRLTWDNNSCGVTALADLTVARFNGLSWDDRGNGGTTGTPAAGTVISAAPQTSYGPFTLASVTLENPLPVELISLDANFRNKSVVVEWKTASEINSDYFLVQRSAEGKQFDVIGNVKAAGNSNSVLEYVFTDTKPLPGVSYYRLNQFDFDGSENITKSVAVKAPDLTDLFQINHIFSDGTSQNVYINLYSSKSESFLLELFDFTGKIIHSNKFNINSGVSTISVAVPRLAKGIYAIRISNEEFVLGEKFGY